MISDHVNMELFKVDQISIDDQTKTENITISNHETTSRKKINLSPTSCFLKYHQHMEYGNHMMGNGLESVISWPL